MRTRTIGVSPPMPYGQRSAWVFEFIESTCGPGRKDGSEYRMRDANRFGVCRHRVNSPNGFILFAAWTAACNKRIVCRHELRLNKQVAECRMGGIRGGRSQDDLRIARYFDFPHIRRLIGNRNAANFGVVLWRNDDLGPGGDAVVAANNNRFIFGK